MNDKYDDICWYHGKISREEAEELLKSGNYFIFKQFNLFIFQNYDSLEIASAFSRGFFINPNSVIFSFLWKNWDIGS